jgi:hypothetical protein
VSPSRSSARSMSLLMKRVFKLSMCIVGGGEGEREGEDERYEPFTLKRSGDH